MRRTLFLSREPTLRESAVILERVSRRLAEHGARIERTPTGSVRFELGTSRRVRLPGSYPLAPISSGSVDVVATGGPRRVCYTLRFAGLRNALVAASVLLGLAGWVWFRPLALGLTALLWLAGYGLPVVFAASRFRRLVVGAAKGLVGHGPLVVEPAAGDRGP